MSEKKTVNEALLKLEKEDPKGAAAKVRAEHLQALNAPKAKACDPLTAEVKAALNIENDEVAHWAARIMRIENPGLL